MARHIKELDIESYRGVENLCLKELNDINILTGNNNSGKTSVLEILFTVDNPHNIGSWARVIRRNKTGIGRKSFYEGFLNLFSVDEDEKYIGYRYIDENKDETTVTLNAEIEETQISEKEMHRINGFMKTGYKRDEEDNIVDTKCMHLSININSEKLEEYSLFDFQSRMSMFIDKKKSFVRTVYISPIDHVLEELYLSDVLANSELYEEMLTILKKFDDNIISINAVPVENGSMARYMVLTKNHKRALPLNTYGDGMKKVILLLSAVVKAKNGILLLDEFETAIHTTAMDTVFSWVLKSAKKLNVQVFLTSHSQEAIDRVLKCDENLQKNINIYTLYKKENRSLVRRMNCMEAINAQDTLGLELR